MSSSVGAQDVNLEKMRSDAMRGKWREVFEKCKQNRALDTAMMTGTGDTELHMAMSNGQEKLVAKRVATWGRKKGYPISNYPLF
ncbi:hypothetical protein QN277_009000 [Acacia crassicarpa]|uniref:Uncharacterized protein n=1 Tax=Acacia crassicarpa TaxID=499986 RepID=A0AAE1M790_9FABA|nr:hypothetical protein QN277_009000 [Acacia crassicarpa]